MVRAAVMSKGGEVSVVQKESPELEPGAVLLETIYSELCGTDVHLKHGRLAGVPYPIIPGHVSVGRVLETRGEVLDISGKSVLPNDQVCFLDVHETCNNCWFCLVAKATTRCPKRKVYGITYSGNDGLLGGWAEQIYLKPGVKIIHLGNVSPLNYIAAGCGLPTALHAVQRAQVPLGATVLVQGSGPVGIMTAMVAKRAGAYQVIMTGAPDHRLEVAKRFGVDKAINVQKLSVEERINTIIDLTDGRGTDITIEASGNPQAVSEGIRATRNAGNMVVVGQYTDNGSIQFNPHLDLNKKHLNLLGCWGSDFSHFYLAVRTLQYSDFPWNKLISAEYGLSDLNKALNDLENLKILKGIVNPKT